MEKKKSNYSKVLKKLGRVKLEENHVECETVFDCWFNVMQNLNKLPLSVQESLVDRITLKVIVFKNNLENKEREAKKEENKDKVD